MGLFDKKDEKTLEYMNNRYGQKFNDSFEIISAEYAGPFSGLDEFYMKSKQMPNRTIRVEKNGRKFRDNYISNYYRNRYEKFITPIFSEVIGECKVITDDAFYMNDKFNEETTFEEFIHSYRNGISAYVILKDDFENEKAYQLAQRLKYLKYFHRKIFLYYFKDEKAFKKINNYSQMSHHIDENYHSCIHSLWYILDEDFQIIKKTEGDYCDGDI